MGGVTDDFGVRLGEVLRAIRTREGLSLRDVERRSEGVFRASVLGAYERGQRQITVRRLVLLLRLYGVPLDELWHLLARRSEEERDSSEPGGVALDLDRLASARGAEPELVRREVDLLRRLRHDLHPRLITVRVSDLTHWAHRLGTTRGRMLSRLDQLGVLLQPQ